MQSILNWQCNITSYVFMNKSIIINFERIRKKKYKFIEKCVHQILVARGHLFKLCR